jgi:hypothetical protein
MHSPIFAPVVALVLWTFVMWVWLYATRIPALSSVAGSGLPPVAVYELAIDSASRTLYAPTHGRGIYRLDL